MKTWRMIMPIVAFMTMSCVACDKKDDGDNNNGNGNPNSKITITATKGGSEVDKTTVELIDNVFTPQGWTITSGYNTLVKTFTLSVSQFSAQPGYSLSIFKSLPSLSEGNYNLIGTQLDNTIYRNPTINPSASYLATSGTLAITKVQVIGSAGGASANYIDGSFSFEAVNPADSSDVIQIDANFTGVATPSQ